jgi:hypothetical protein
MEGPERQEVQTNQEKRARHSKQHSKSDVPFLVPLSPSLGAPSPSCLSPIPPPSSSCGSLRCDHCQYLALSSTPLRRPASDEIVVVMVVVMMVVVVIVAIWIVL